MQVFEFHFNPPKQSKLATGQIKVPDLIFDSFCYEPENIYEKRLGSLYMVGFLKNVLPQNLRLLDQLTKVIKEEYYRPTLHSPEKSLKESLRMANEFLEKISKRGDVSWLGNLSFTVLSLIPHPKNGGGELIFTKVGNVKIFLLRDGQVIDIDQKLKFEEVEPYPLKIFGNIVSGKLAEDDIVLVLTKEVFEAFQKENFLIEIAKLVPKDQSLDIELKEILNGKRDELSKIPGICLLILLSKEILAKKRETISPQPKKFSVKQIFSPVVVALKGLIKKPKLVIERRRPSLKLPKLKLPKVTIPVPKLPKINKSVILILALIFSLTLGFLIFQKEKSQRLKEYQITLNQIHEKVDRAESFLILKETKPEIIPEANSLLIESWEEISPLTKVASTLPQNFSSQIFSLRDEISKNLYELNKLIEITEPELVFEFDAQEFVPKKLISDGKNLYFFSSYSQNLFEVNIQTKEKKFTHSPLDKGEGLDSALLSADSILFFSKPNNLVNFKNSQFSETLSLKEPYSDFNFDDFSSYKSNLYFLDKNSGEIVKYPYLGNFEWGSPQLWLNHQIKTTRGKSMAIDGSVWILGKDNSISRYHAGKYQETLKLSLFPYPKDFSKIFTLPGFLYLYILEPAQSRIIVLNKIGQVAKQFQSDKFDNLLDFAVSEDGKTIYLLNGSKVYQVKL